MKPARWKTKNRGKVTLILSVTVLQHILDDDKLSALIGKFESSLSKHGKVVIFESVANIVTSSNYQKLRRVEDVVEIFQSSGLTLKSVFNFYHPSDMPTELFEKYRKNLMVRMLNRLCSLRIPGIRYLLTQIAHYWSDKDNGIIEENSITKIFVFGKIQ